MSERKTFTIDEARALLPELRQMLVLANDQLDDLAERLDKLSTAHDSAERAMAAIKTSTAQVTELKALRQCRARFEKATNDVTRAQQDYMDCLQAWVERIGETGVILRDLQTGLLDFPARKDNFIYFLCWRLDDEDITSWHCITDGFIGRKPLITLAEYF